MKNKKPPVIKRRDQTDDLAPSHSVALGKPVRNSSATKSFKQNLRQLLRRNKRILTELKVAVYYNFKFIGNIAYRLLMIYHVEVHLLLALASLILEAFRSTGLLHNA